MVPNNYYNGILECKLGLILKVNNKSMFYSKDINCNTSELDDVWNWNNYSWDVGITTK